jgi:hypothetical protein
MGPISLSPVVAGTITAVLVYATFGYALAAEGIASVTVFWVPVFLNCR